MKSVFLKLQLTHLQWQILNSEGIRSSGRAVLTLEIRRFFRKMLDALCFSDFQTPPVVYQNILFSRLNYIRHAVI